MNEKHGSWGGRREGAGRKATWKSGPCKAVRIPISLVDEVMRYARQLDEGAELPFPLALASPGPAPALLPARLEAQVAELTRRLDQVLAERSQLAAELATLRRQGGAAIARPVPTEEATSIPPTPSEPGAAPPWLATVTKRIADLPKRETRLMVLHLLVDHQAYVEERLREHEKRGPVAGASERARAQWQQGRQAHLKRIQEMGQLFAAFPPDLITEARALRVANWRSRASVGARRSYDAILARINDASS